MALSKQITPTPVLDRFLAWCVAAGYAVGENPRYGTRRVTPNVHVVGSWHYAGLAADINHGPNGPTERTALLRALAVAESLGLAVTYARDGVVGSAANHRNHLHVDVGEWSNYGSGVVRAKRATTNQVPGADRATDERDPKRLPLIKRGSRGGWVGLWQKVLGARGVSVRVDEVFGPDTEAATRGWQRAHGLTPDGEPGPRTWCRALAADRDGQLRSGDRGPHVEIWQNIIGVAPDEVFGPDTDRATRAVQRRLGVTDDGVVGAATRTALLNYWLK